MPGHAAGGYPQPQLALKLDPTANRSQVVDGEHHDTKSKLYDKRPVVIVLIAGRIINFIPDTRLQVSLINEDCFRRWFRHT